MGEHRKQEISVHGGQPPDDKITPAEILVLAEQTYRKQGTESPRLRRARLGAQQILGIQTGSNYSVHEPGQKITPPFAPPLPGRRS